MEKVLTGGNMFVSVWRPECTGVIGADVGRHRCVLRQ